MTTSSDNTFELKAATGVDGVLHAELAGDFAWDATDELLDVARAHLSAAPDPSDIRLDCARMTLCDSMGLSALLALHRDTAAAGVRLHLERRPPFLDRLLLLTGTYEHLTGRPEAAGASGPDGTAPGGEADGPPLPYP
ncbi:STAS domain-containing protein [Streptomyces sp. NPDC053431]|uniref:STAS domain-containing protein n=1 Tax=Streptomyces sp. NPDC053431 TaxID=3365703 RepID=UPI0037D972B5